MRMRNMMFAAAAATLAASPAMSQVSNAGGLITVNIPVQNVDILNNFLNDTQIAALNNLNVPITVQAPISVAANVCGVNVAALASQEQGRRKLHRDERLVSLGAARVAAGARSENEAQPVT